MLITKSTDLFDPAQVSLARRWSQFFLDRSIECDEEAVWVNGREVNISFVSVSRAATMPDSSSYMLVEAAGDSDSIEAVEDDMCYIVRFNDVAKPFLRFESRRMCFDKYMQMTSLFSCTADQFQSWIDKGLIIIEQGGSTQHTELED